MERRRAGLIGGTLFAVAMVNFFAFFAHCQALGGDALNGKRVDGRFYVGNHGRYTEVAEWQWYLSRAHAVSVLITGWLGVLVGGGLLTYAGHGRRKPSSPAEPSSPASGEDTPASPEEPKPTPEGEHADSQPDWVIPLRVKVGLVLFILVVVSCAGMLKMN